MASPLLPHATVCSVAGGPGLPCPFPATHDGAHGLSRLGTVEATADCDGSD